MSCSSFLFQSAIQRRPSNKCLNKDHTNSITLEGGCICLIIKPLAKKTLYEPELQKDCAKVSAVGAGMTGVPGVTAKIVG